MTPRRLLATLGLATIVTVGAGCVPPFDNPKLAGTRIGTPLTVVDEAPQVVRACTTPDGYPFTFYGPAETMPAQCQVKE